MFAHTLLAHTKDVQSGDDRLQELQAAAESGGGQGAYDLGCALLDRDPAEAIRWIESAAAKGQDAAKELAILLFTDEMFGVPQDLAKANHWRMQLDTAAAEAVTDGLPTPAMVRLRNYMSDISEDCWCAGWLTGLEYDLWRAVIRGPAPLGQGSLGHGSFGQGLITRENLAVLRHLSTECGGWVAWLEDWSDEAFVPMDRWQEIFAEHSRKRES